MKLLENHFEDYLKNKEDNDLHSNFNYKIIPDDINNLQNLIIYGPPGIGKYSQMLSIIKKYSPTNLKYEKKMSITFNKNIYYFKISDIHFEIDVALLGCNSKLLWNEIYNNIIDVILTRSVPVGIIVCKNFHEIHSELLEIFYSYMQSMLNSQISLKFIILTEEISFIPKNIINCSKTFPISRPSKNTYSKKLKINMNKKTTDSITNIKDLISNNTQYSYSSQQIFKDIISTINYPNLKMFNFIDIREKLYELFIYNYNIPNFIWNVLNYLIISDKIKEEYNAKVLIKTYEFLKYFNNNYRSIFHLESYILYLISIVHELS
tara:strand:+ start:27 stop:989 length:963 start_codon:yes stop_codon:yes gene_type:complete